MPKLAVQEPFRYRNGVLLSLFFLSGLSALIYEVMWLKELGLLFGNTAYAAATTLGAFFLGLSAGGFYWGRKSPSIKAPLRTYALLELGVCAAALFYLLAFKAYDHFYPALFAGLGTRPALFLAVKFFLASSLLFLPAFFMGGTLPVMGQQFIRWREMLGRKGTILYALNTAGAAVGAFIAGFYLPIHLGFLNSYLLACSLNLGIALIAWQMSRAQEVGTAPPMLADPGRATAAAEDMTRLTRLVWLIAFLSGFITLGLEVLWTQMFKQVLQNSVYSFSVVLVTFLLALALGSLIANGLCRLRQNPFVIMTVLMIAAALAIYLSPWIFYRLTHGLEEISLVVGWSRYVMAIFGVAAVVIFLPCTIMGTIFPYLLKMYQGKQEAAGQTIGRLMAINTIGAILGSISAGFVFSGAVGIWTSIKMMAVVYMVVAVFVLEKVTVRRLALRAVVSAGLIVTFWLFLPFDFPIVNVSAAKNETLYEVWQGSYGTVAVVQRDDDLKIKINNNYDIGGSASYSGQTWQTRIPLFLHPEPRKVFYLGLGTGITAGGALDHPVEKVVVTELIPEVVTASRKYFAPVTNRLYQDPRVEVLVEDGRNYLLGTRQKYDAVISDLFTPWRAGIGSLYSLEHFRTVRSRLEKGGLFAQWLPLAQLSQQEFGIIARTLSQVFPQVTLWRLNTPPTGPLVVLIARSEIRPLQPDEVRASVEKVLGSQGTEVIPYVYYVGNISANAELFADYPVNTENRPVIEYLSPITRQKTHIGAERNFVGYDFVTFYEALLTRLPPGQDPYLQKLGPHQRNFIYAGMHLYKSYLYRLMARTSQADQAYQNYQFYLQAGKEP